MSLKDASVSRSVGVSWAFLLKPLAALALLHSGAIFGFFYAWICSTMWGLDAADPNVAIWPRRPERAYMDILKNVTRSG